jgi:hypothetical protein
MSVGQLALILIGTYLIWFGVTHFGQRNPFGPIKSVLQGKGFK